MRNIFLLLTLVLGLNAQAANYGKFKLYVDTGYYAPQEVVFLMNSSGEIKMLENNDYYKIDSQFFFGESTLNIRSGGDDDIVKGIVSLKNNRATEACAVFLSLSSGYGERLRITRRFNLLRWNRFAKKYETVLKSDTLFSKKCEKKILADYPNFSIH